MKKSKSKKEAKKFDLEKMEFAKLKNMHLIKGGSEIDTNNPKNGKVSSGQCAEED